MRVSIIDVGKGDCILVQSGKANLLIDTGYKNTADTVVSSLENQGVDKLDALILTHYDQDHIGGFREVSRVFGTDALYLPGYRGSDKNYEETMSVADALSTSSCCVKQVQQFVLDSVEVCIYPTEVAYDPNAKGSEGNDNDTSLVVSLRSGADSYLFAGDLEEEGIEAYLRNNHGNFDVLKVPHHGEKCAKTDDFLDSVQPKIAVVTDSKDEPADKKTRKALEKHAVDAYFTSKDGSITLESDGSGAYSVTCSQACGGHLRGAQASRDSTKGCRQAFRASYCARRS